MCQSVAAVYSRRKFPSDAAHSPVIFYRVDAQVVERYFGVRSMRQFDSGLMRHAVL